jgi:hypothetical protein
LTENKTNFDLRPYVLSRSNWNGTQPLNLKFTIAGRRIEYVNGQAITYVGGVFIDSNDVGGVDTANGRLSGPIPAFRVVGFGPTDNITIINNGIIVGARGAGGVGGTGGPNGTGAGSNGTPGGTAIFANLAKGITVINNGTILGGGGGGGGGGGWYREITGTQTTSNTRWTASNLQCYKRDGAGDAICNSSCGPIPSREVVGSGACGSYCSNNSWFGCLSYTSYRACYSSCTSSTTYSSTSYVAGYEFGVGGTGGKGLGSNDSYSVSSDGREIAPTAPTGFGAFGGYGAGFGGVGGSGITAYSAAGYTPPANGLGGRKGNYYEGPINMINNVGSIYF